MVKVERTEAQKYVIRQLEKAVAKGMPYRVGVMLLSYPPTDPAMACRIAFGTGMRSKVDSETVMDLIQMSKMLRKLADQMDAVIAHPEAHGPLPLEVCDGDVDN